MKVELIDYTKDGIQKIATLSRSTRKENPEKINKGYQQYHSETESIVMGPKYTSEKEKKDEHFVRQLIKVQHLGILEHINFTFQVEEISRVLTHQLVRHRIGFSFLQMSSRHAKPTKDMYYLPESFYKTYSELGVKHSLCDESEDYYNGPFDDGEVEKIIENMYDKYIYCINNGIPIEDARYILPPAFFTHISFTCNARSLRHFLELRLDKHAQAEIRELACRIFDIVYEKYPIIFESVKELRDKND